MDADGQTLAPLAPDAVTRVLFSHGNEEDEVKAEDLFAKFLDLGRTDFVASLCGECGECEFSDSAAGLVADWFQFAHLGCFVRDAPLSWVLAAARVPYSNPCVQASQIVRAADVFDRWTGHHGADVVMLQDLLGASRPVIGSFMPCLDSMARDLKDPSRQCWLSPGGTRDE
jgi:hypothetical protein